MYSELNILEESPLIFNKLDESIPLRLSNTTECGNYKLFKSNYTKNQYSNLLLSNENNKNYYKKLIETNKDNLNIKMIYVKLLIQYSELVNRLTIQFNNYENIDNDFKYDIMILRWLEYINYRDALNTLSTCKVYNNKLINYDIDDRIDTLSFKTNLSALEFVYSKIDYYNIPNNQDLITIREMIGKYELTHDDNILTNMKTIENKYKKNIVEGFSNTNNNNILYILLALLLLYFFSVN